MGYLYFKNSIEFYFDSYAQNKKGLDAVLKKAWKNALINYSKSNIKYHRINSKVLVDWNNLDQSVYLLYFSSRIAFLRGDINMASMFYRLNRMLNAIDVFYEVELPIHTMFIHPVGTVLGRAEFGDYLVVYQGVTVGSDLNGNFPKLDGNNVLFSNSSLLANSVLGKNCGLGARAFAYNVQVNDNQFLKADDKSKYIEPETAIIKKYYSV